MSNGRLSRGYNYQQQQEQQQQQQQHLYPTAYPPLAESPGIDPTFSLTSSTAPPYDMGAAYESGGYHDRQGLVTGAAGLKASKRRGCYRPSSIWQWAFIWTALLQALIALAMECYVFGVFQVSLIPGASDSNARTIPTYLSLLIFGFVYQLILVYDALHYQNTIQVIGLCIYNIGLLAYTAIQIDQIQDAVTTLGSKGQLVPSRKDNLWPSLRPFLIAVPCIIGLGTVVLSGIAWKLYEEFAWNIYKQISADLRLKRRFLIYQIYIALLKFDFFLFLGFEIQFLVIVPNTTGLEFYLTIASIPVTIILLIFAAWSIKRESVAGTAVVIFVYFAGLAYFLFKLVRMYAADISRLEDYQPARRSLTTFAVITIILLVITIVIACWCTVNFGKGLKQHISGGLWGTGRKPSRRGRKGDADSSADAYGLETGSDKLYSDHAGGHYGQQAMAAPGFGGSRMTID